MKRASIAITIFLLVLLAGAPFAFSKSPYLIPPETFNAIKGLILTSDDKIEVTPELITEGNYNYIVSFLGKDDTGLYVDTIKLDSRGGFLGVVTRQIFPVRLYKRLKSASEVLNWNIDPLIALDYTYGDRFDDAIASLNKAIELSTITGIGVSISIKENYPVVMQVSESGPAKGAGIEVGDRIIKINGQSTKGWDVNKVAQNLRGEAGTEVTITIERKGLDKPVEKTIKRQRILTEDAADPLGLRSLFYAIKGDYEKAGKDAETAYSLNPDNGWSKRARSFSYIIAGKPEEAIKILSTIKDSPFDRLLECLAYSKKGDLKKSAEIYASIPEYHFPEDYFISKDAFSQSFKNAVLESLAPYVESRKENVKALEAKGQYREALKEYAELLKIADQTKRKEILGHVAVLLKKQPYLMELPERARKYAIRAEVMTKEGKFVEAVKEYREAIRIAPFYPLLYKAIALNYAELKDYKKAIEIMNTYIELYPDAPDVRAAKDEIYKWEFMMEKGGK